MARRYTRDNRGRFASVGATARGGRLKTAAGNKRDTQTKAISGGKPAGTIGKSRAAKPAAVSPKQQRQLEAERIGLRRPADANSSRMGYTNATAADQSRLYKSGSADRARIAQIDNQLKGAKPLPTVLANGRPLTGEKMGRYKGDGRFSLYGKDRGVIGRGRLPSTVRKPAGLKPGLLTPKPAVTAKPVAARKVDYNGAVKQLNRQAAAIRRVNSPQQTFNGNANYARQIDLRTARSSPMQNAVLGIRAAKGDLRRAQATASNPYASAEIKARAVRDIPKMRKQVVSAVRIARAFKPANAPETKRLYQASKARK